MLPEFEKSILLEQKVSGEKVCLRQHFCRLIQGSRVRVGRLVCWSVNVVSVNVMTLSQLNEELTVNKMIWEIQKRLILTGYSTGKQ